MVEVLFEKRRQVSRAVKNAKYFYFLGVFTIEHQIIGIVARGDEANAGKTSGTETWACLDRDGHPGFERSQRWLSGYSPPHRDCPVRWC